MLSALPIRIRNDDLVTITEVTNSISSVDQVISELDFEKQICYALSQNVLPVDLSANLESENSSLSIIGNKERFNGIMISNNEDLIDSETMAMKVNYVTNAQSTSNVEKTYSLYTGFQQKITLIGSDTTSFMNSHLRLDVSYNNDLQNSTIINNENEGDWKMSIDRSDGVNNYFAAINTHLNTLDGSHPMKVTLLENPMLFSDTTYISSIDSNTKEYSYNNFDSDYSFDSNHLQGTVDDNYNYQSEDFTMYKLVQDEPTINETIYNGTAADLPVGDSNGNDLTTPSLANFESNVYAIIGNNIDQIQDGYNIRVLIGDETNGGFQLADGENGVLSINTSNIINSYEFIEAGISNTTEMYIDVSNGSVSLQGGDNLGNVSLLASEEKLEYPYNTENGSIQIRVQDVNNRITVLGISNEDWYGEDVRVIYNCGETTPGCIESRLDAAMTVNPYVEYAAGIVVPTTTGSSYSSSDNSFNLLKSNDSVLVIANDSSYNPAMPNYSDMNFNSYINTLYSDNNTIVYLTIQNTNTLTEDTPLKDNNGTDVPNSISTVKLTNINLSDSVYSDYQIRLDTKTITDLSNAALSSESNGWIIESINGTDTYLHTSSIKNSILYDDCLFMRSGLDTSFNYTFSIVHPTVANAQAIKHRIDISFTDISVDTETGDTVQVSNYAYLDDDDIEYSNITYVNTSTTALNGYSVSTNPYNLSTSNTRVDRITNTVRYNVSFDPKLPFYTNIKLSSPLITEYVDSYKLYDNTGKQLPDVYLKYFTKDGISLSLVNVSQSSTEVKTDLYKTSLNVTRSNCSTLLATLQGKDITDTFVPVSNVDPQDQDPWFNTTTEFVGVNGYNANVSVVVQVTYPTELSNPYYIIDTTNAPGTKVSFTTTLYKYDTSIKDASNDSFNHFDPYNSQWVLNGNTTFDPNFDQNNLPTYITLDNLISLDSNNRLTLTIYGEDGESTLATLEQPNTIINDFNIIYCYDPLVRVMRNVRDLNDELVINDMYYSLATLTSNNKREIFVDDGVYAYTTLNPPRYSYIDFTLNSDEVRVEFVYDSNYSAGGYNNGWDSFVYLTDISGANTNVFIDADDNLRIELLSGDSNGLNSTQPVVFNKYRGYNRVTGGTDTISIVRTSSTATFVLDGSNGTYTQTFNNFATNGTYTVDHAVNQSNTDVSFNLGLDISGIVSLMDVNTARYYITITGASISWTFYNPDNNENVYYYGSSDLTQSSFSDLFGWKSRSIFSDYYEINITYNIPDIKVYNLNQSGSEVYGNPLDKTISNWTNSTTHTLSDSIGFKISGVDVRRTQSYVPGTFTAYTVIIPPQLRVQYNTAIQGLSFPFNQSNATYTNYYITLVNPNTSSYLVLNNTASQYQFTLINDNIPRLQYYSDLNNEQIEVLGNYLNIKYYNDVSANEVNNTPYTVFNGRFDELEGLNNDDLRVAMTSNSVVYDVSFRQLIGSSQSSNVNSTYNIHFTISDAFIGPPPTSIYFDLLAAESTVITFYQSNVRLIDSSYILVIDKYECSGYDYNGLMVDHSLNELFFIASTHYTSTFAIDGKQLPISNTALNINDLFSTIDMNDIAFVRDNGFSARNIGVTLSALSNQGIVNLQNLVKYTHDDYLLSTVSYINMPDIIKVTSLFGSNVFRLTNSGNVKTPSITSYAYNVVDSTQLYNLTGNVMNNSNISNAGFVNSETVIDTIPNAPSGSGRQLTA